MIRASGKVNYKISNQVLQVVREVTPSLSDHRALPVLLQRDANGSKKRGKSGRTRPVGVQTSFCTHSHYRLKKVAGRLGMPLGDLIRISVHTMLPRFEKAADSVPSPEDQHREELRVKLGELEEEQFELNRKRALLREALQETNAS